MKITIQWCESKISSKGTDYKKCSIVDESGRKLEDVAVFSSFNHYSAIMPGAEVEGVIEQKTYNGKISYSLGNMVSTAYTRSNGPSKSSQMVKIMDKKAENIATAQENKHEAIKLAGAQRDAVLMVTTFHQGEELHDSQLKEEIEKWMKYFIDLGNQPFI